MSVRNFIEDGETMVRDRIINIRLSLLIFPMDYLLYKDLYCLILYYDYISSFILYACLSSHKELIILLFNPCIELRRVLNVLYGHLISQFFILIGVVL